MLLMYKTGRGERGERGNTFGGFLCVCIWRSRTCLRANRLPHSIVPSPSSCILVVAIVVVISVVAVMVAVIFVVFVERPDDVEVAEVGIGMRKVHTNCFSPSV